MLESLLVPTGIVALAEIGDKTQLLALLLACRFRRPWPIIWGIVIATLANHFAAGAVGNWVAGFFSATTLSWVLAACFAAVAAAMHAANTAPTPATRRWSVVGTAPRTSHHTAADPVVASAPEITSVTDPVSAP